MRTSARAIAAMAMVAAASTSARAEDVATYDANGDADAGAADPRVAALDDAFAKAVNAAIADLVAGDVRAARKADLDRELVGHARLWIASFKVTRDDTVDGRRQLAVSVRIDRDKLRARATELGIAATAVAPPPDAVPAKSVTILLRLTTPQGVRADYGTIAEKDLPGVAALGGVLARANMTLRRAPASGPAARGTGELPLDDDEAEALAGDAHADLAAIAGVTVGAPEPVRGVATPAQRVDAHLKVIVRRGHALVGQGAAIGVARTGDPAAISAAIDRTLTAAAMELIPPSSHRIAAANAAPTRADDIPLASPNAVLLRLPARTPWPMIELEQRYLAGARGVQATVLRRLSPLGWVLAVSTQLTPTQIAAIAKKPPSADTAASVHVTGDVIEVTLTGAAP
jgi:hypothetical protein